MNTDIKNIVEQLISESLENAFTYEEYRELVDNLVAEGKTTGPEQTEAFVNYTLLNSRRLKRWEKTLKLSEEHFALAKKWNRPVQWLVLTESWCGDAAPTMPVMQKIAELNEHIKLKVLLRDEHIDLMDHFLTDGARSIPKLIMLDANTQEVLGDWGPRPSTAADMAADYKKSHGVLSPEFKEELQLWYNADKGKTTFRDLVQLLTLENIGDSTLL